MKIFDEEQRQQESNENGHIEEKVLQIKKESLFCHFCKRDNHRMENCFKLKQFQQFKEFELFLQQKEKETEKMTEKANEITEEENDDELILSINQAFQSDHCKKSKGDRKSKVKTENLPNIVETFKNVTKHRIEIEDSIENKFKKINQLSQCFNHLKILEIELDDRFKTAALLSSPPEEYKEVILAIKTTNCDWEDTKKVVKSYIKRKEKNGNISSKKGKTCTRTWRKDGESSRLDII